MTSPKPNRDQVFISYSHVDQSEVDWLSKLKLHLGLFKRQGTVDVWDDKRIETGSKWRDQIKQAIERAKVAVLLVEPGFLGSKFIAENELPPLLEAAEKEGVKIFPLVVGHCAYEKSELEPFQAFNDPSRPLESLSSSDRNKILKDISVAIEGAFNRTLVPSSNAGGTQSGRPWNVPYPRNLFFTGREEVLKQLRAALISGGEAALSGLGGIGKTQTAVEYAYQYRNDYKAVLWVKADSHEALVSDFVAIAGLLNLSAKDLQDQNLAVAAVRRWLEDSTDWLLILDNADNLAMAREFIPSGGKGHVLLTTLAQATGTIAQRIEIVEMEPQEGTLFLLRRAKIIAADAPLDKASNADRAQAEQISKELGGLPLALDQAGAYIEETACGLSDYLDLYRTQGAKLLKRRGMMVSDHPNPVAITFALSFERVEKASPAAAELLRLCAFLHLNAIPEEIITEGASELGPVLQSAAADSFGLNAAIAEILKYSLLRRDPTTKTLTIHRLAQAVVKDGMDEAKQRLWAERTVRAVNRAFPEVEFSNWHLCERLLPHAQACAELIEKWELEFHEAGQLLNQAGFYLHDRARFSEVEPFYQRSLVIWKKALGPEHPDVATSLNNLAALYHAQGKYDQAEPLYRRALAIDEKTLGPEHPNVATDLNNLAELYRAQGKYTEAEPLYQQALAIRERTLGPEHPNVATTLNNLALLYYNQGKYDQAEPLYRRALAIDEKTLGPEHPNVATDLNNLAELYHAQGKYTEAESLYQRALTICEKALGADHPNAAFCLNNLAVLYNDQGQYAQAEPLLRQSLAIREKTLGLDHPDVATTLENYADLLRKTNREAEATKMEVRAKAIRAKHAQENPRK